MATTSGHCFSRPCSCAYFSIMCGTRRQLPHLAYHGLGAVTRPLHIPCWAASCHLARHSSPSRQTALPSGIRNLPPCLHAALSQRVCVGGKFVADRPASHRRHRLQFRQARHPSQLLRQSLDRRQYLFSAHRLISSKETTHPRWHLDPRRPRLRELLVWHRHSCLCFLDIEILDFQVRARYQITNYPLALDEAFPRWLTAKC